MPVPERLEDPDPSTRLGREHLARYRFAAGLARGRVLDLACGSGYGSLMLAQLHQVSQVVAADHAEPALASLRARLGRQGAELPLETVGVDAQDPELPAHLGRFDTIVSFETIEHVHDDVAMLGSLQAMLRPEGCLIISTPLGRGRGIPTGDPFHVRQYTWPQWRRLLADRFGVIAWFGQDGGEVVLPQLGRSYRIAVGVCTRPKGVRD